MKSKPTVEERLRRALRRLLKDNHSRVGEIETAVGMRRSYLSDIARGIRPMRGKKFKKALKLLGRPPRDFFSRALAPVDVEAMLEKLPLPKRLPERIAQLRRVVRRVSASPAGGDPEKVAAVRRQAAELDELRHSDPHAAREQTYALARSCPDDTRALYEILAAYASAERMLGQAIRAAYVYRLIVPISFALGARTEAQCYQRVSYLLRDFQRVDDALRVATEAGALYLGEQDMEGVAKILVNLAFLHFYQQDLDQAMRLSRSALALLPATLRRHRLTALHIIGACCTTQGLWSEAEDALEATEALLDAEPSYAHYAVFKTRGELSAAQDDMAQAYTYFGKAREIIRVHNPYDLAIVTLDIIEMLLALGKTQEAWQELSGVAALLEPLRGNPGAQLILLDLLRIERRAVTRPLLQKAKQQIEEARTSLPEGR